MNDIRIVIADDHKMVSSAFTTMVNDFDKCSVLYRVSNGKELLDRFETKKLIPDLVLLDINMPVMNGFETMKAIHDNYPEVLVLCLSMNDDKDSFLKMIELGAHGFISKMASEQELDRAIKQVMEKRCYYTAEMADMLFRSMSAKKEKKNELISSRECQFLTYVPTELTYQQIANEMCLSPKTVDGYRNALFQKLEVKSRVGLAIYAVKNGYFSLDS